MKQDDKVEIIRDLLWKANTYWGAHIDWEDAYARDVRTLLDLVDDLHRARDIARLA